MQDCNTPINVFLASPYCITLNCHSLLHFILTLFASPTLIIAIIIMIISTTLNIFIIIITMIIVIILSMIIMIILIMIIIQIKRYLSAGVVDNLLTAMQITLEAAAKNLYKCFP